MALPADSTVENRRLLAWISEPQLYPLFQLQSIVEKNTPRGRSAERRLVPERLVVLILLLPSSSFRLDTQNSPNYTKMQHTHTHTHPRNFLLTAKPKKPKTKTWSCKSHNQNTQNSVIHCHILLSPSFPKTQPKLKPTNKALLTATKNTQQENWKALKKKDLHCPKKKLIN